MNRDEYLTLRDERVPMMPRAEYNRLYPRGVPRTATHKLGTPEEIQAYRDWRSALKRDDWDAGSGGRMKWLLILALLVVASVVAGIMVGSVIAGVMMFLMLCFCIAFVEGMMNAPW